MSVIEHMPNATSKTPSNTLANGEQFPNAMGPRDMARAFGISYETFRRLERMGEFKPFELPRAIGIRRWAFVRVQQFLAGRK